MSAGYNWDHFMALAFIGVGALFLLYTGHTEGGSALLGVIGGYAFKNGVIKQIQASEVPKQGQ